jgi:hypothetical protein
MIIILQFLAGDFMSCEKDDPVTITFNFVSAMGVRDAALTLSPPTPTPDLSLTHYTYTLQFCLAAFNKKLASVVYSIANYSFIIALSKDLHPDTSNILQAHTQHLDLAEQRLQTTQLRTWP